jgi:hypothetical protein
MAKGVRPTRFMRVISTSSRHLVRHAWVKLAPHLLGSLGKKSKVLEMRVNIAHFVYCCSSNTVHLFALRSIWKDSRRPTRTSQPLLVQPIILNQFSLRMFSQILLAPQTTCDSYISRFCHWHFTYTAICDSHHLFNIKVHIANTCWPTMNSREGGGCFRISCWSITSVERIIQKKTQIISNKQIRFYWFFGFSERYLQV